MDGSEILINGPGRSSQGGVLQKCVNWKDTVSEGQDCSLNEANSAHPGCMHCIIEALLSPSGMSVKLGVVERLLAVLEDAINSRCATQTEYVHGPLVEALIAQLNCVGRIPLVTKTLKVLVYINYIATTNSLVCKQGRKDVVMDVVLKRFNQSIVSKTPIKSLKYILILISNITNDHNYSPNRELIIRLMVVFIDNSDSNWSCGYDSEKEFALILSIIHRHINLTPDVNKLVLEIFTEKMKHLLKESLGANIDLLIVRIMSYLLVNTPMALHEPTHLLVVLFQRLSLYGQQDSGSEVEFINLIIFLMNRYNINILENEFYEYILEIMRVSPLNPKLLEIASQFIISQTGYKTREGVNKLFDLKYLEFYINIVFNYLTTTQYDDLTLSEFFEKIEYIVLRIECGSDSSVRCEKVLMDLIERILDILSESDVTKFGRMWDLALRVLNNLVRASRLDRFTIDQVLMINSKLVEFSSSNHNIVKSIIDYNVSLNLKGGYNLPFIVRLLDLYKNIGCRIEYTSVVSWFYELILVNEFNNELNDSIRSYDIMNGIFAMDHSIFLKDEFKLKLCTILAHLIINGNGYNEKFFETLKFNELVTKIKNILFLSTSDLAGLLNREDYIHLCILVVYSNFDPRNSSHKDPDSMSKMTELIRLITHNSVLTTINNAKLAVMLIVISQSIDRVNGMLKVIENFNQNDREYLFRHSNENYLFFLNMVLNSINSENASTICNFISIELDRCSSDGLELYEKHIKISNKSFEFFVNYTNVLVKKELPFLRQFEFVSLFSDLTHCPNLRMIIAVLLESVAALNSPSKESFEEAKPIVRLLLKIIPSCAEPDYVHISIVVNTLLRLYSLREQFVLAGKNTLQTNHINSIRTVPCPKNKANLDSGLEHLLEMLKIYLYRMIQSGENWLSDEVVGTVVSLIDIGSSTALICCSLALLCSRSDKIKLVADRVSQVFFVLSNTISTEDIAIHSENVELKLLVVLQLMIAIESSITEPNEFYLQIINNIFQMRRVLRVNEIKITLLMLIVFLMKRQFKHLMDSIVLHILVEDILLVEPPGASQPGSVFGVGWIDYNKILLILFLMIAIHRPLWLNEGIQLQIKDRVLQLSLCCVDRELCSFISNIFGLDFTHSDRTFGAALCDRNESGTLPTKEAIDEACVDLVVRDAINHCKQLLAKCRLVQSPG